MSLINEALKKAQHMRSRQSDDAVDGRLDRARSRAGSSVVKVVAIAGSGVILVFASVLVTLHFVRRPVESIQVAPTSRGSPLASPQTSAASVEPKPAPVNEAAARSLEIAKSASASMKESSPRITLPTSVADSLPKTIAGTPSSDGSNPGAVSTKTDTPTAGISSPSPLQATQKEVTGNAAIQAFVNHLNVTGIRALGGESRVLMNDRVYRINDIVDRSLGLRLLEVHDDRLVFVDENGAKYVRNF